MALTDDELRWLYRSLKQVEFISFCPLGDIEKLMNRLLKKRYAKGSTIVRQGDSGDCLFLLQSGSVSVQVREGKSEKEVSRLGGGTYFGEMALVSNEPRAASVIALEDTEAFLLPSIEFRKLIENNPDLERKLTEIVARRKVDRPIFFGNTQNLSVWGKFKQAIGL